MKLSELSIKNYRSIKSMEDAKISSFQAFIGENNAGKSNILHAIEIFLSAGSGGVTEEDFGVRSDPIVIKMKLDIQSERLRRVWKPYAINNVLILEKHLRIDDSSGKPTIKHEFHGYRAIPFK